MSRQVLGAVVTTACLISGTASAQVALGAARTPGVTVHRPDPPREEPAPPSRPPHAHHHPAQQSPAPGSDLFRAGPDTYVPHRDRSRRYFASYPGLSGYVAAYTPGIVETVIVREPIIIEIERPPRERETTAVRQPAPAPEPIVIYVTPPKAKTLYVIPRCYAGDKRPSAAELPMGCDLSLLRVIPAASL